MPTSFSTDHDPPIPEAADEEDGSFRDSEPDDDFSESGTEALVSDYEGNVKGTPLRMFFGPKECLRIFVPEKGFMILLLPESMWTEGCTPSSPSKNEMPMFRSQKTHVMLNWPSR
jgi:hypothetical protein